MPVVFKAQVDQICTRIQSISALAFSGFLVLHLAAPLAAVPYGEVGATRTMLIARELYQTRLGEPLIYAAAGTHVASGLVRRISRKNERISWHQLAGMGLIPLLIGHANQHRWRPFALHVSPSLLNYSFVSYSLQKTSFKSILTYGLLILFTSYHAIGGLRSILSSRTKQAGLIGKEWQGTALALVTSLGLGLARLSTHEVPNFLARRYDLILK